MNDAQKLKDEIVELGKAVFDGTKKKKDQNKKTIKQGSNDTNTPGKFQSFKVTPPVPPKSPAFEFKTAPDTKSLNPDSNPAKNKNGKINTPDCRPVKELLELGFSQYIKKI